MSIEHDITYSLSVSGGSAPPLRVTRAITGQADGSLDWPVPDGSSNLTGSFSLLLAKVQSIFLVCDQAVTLRAGGANAVQQLAVTGGPTGGTFTASFGGQTTAPVPYNATAAQMAAALNLLSTIGAAGVTATGGPLPASPVLITFGGVNSGGPVATLTTADSLTGGTTPATAVTVVTAGVAADTTIAVKAQVPLVWDSQAYAAQPFLADVSVVRVTNLSGSDCTLKIRTLSNA